MEHKMHAVMSEYKAGTLRSSSGKKVRQRKQAVAIGLSEARRAGEHVPPMKHPPHGSGTFTKADLRRGYKKIGEAPTETVPGKLPQAF